MPYTPSGALLTYYTREKEIFMLLRTISNKLVMKNTPVITPVIRAGIVLLYSHIEGYIEDVVEEAIDFINNSGISSNALPSNLKVAHCMIDITELLNIQDATKREAMLNTLFIKNFPLFSGANLPPAKIDSNCLIKNFSNPSFEKIDKLFKQLGINKIFSTFYSLGFPPQRVRLIKPTLDALAELRHDVAHGNFKQSCSFCDMINYTRTMKLLCKCIDASLGKYLEELTGIWPWEA